MSKYKDKHKKTTRSTGKNKRKEKRETISKDICIYIQNVWVNKKRNHCLCKKMIFQKNKIFSYGKSTWT
jgi:hypothetical protein